MINIAHRAALNFMLYYQCVDINISLLSWVTCTQIKINLSLPFPTRCSLTWPRLHRCRTACYRQRWRPVD